MVDDPTLHAILASLNEGDGDDTLGDMRNGLDRLEELSDPKLASLICCKEGIAKMKDRIVVEDPEMRAMFILRLGKVIVRTLLIVGAESFDIEGYVRVESRTESRRMIEDFMDMATDVMKSFALGALGKAPAADSSQVFADNIECCNAYCEVLTLLLNSYNSAFEPLDSWTDALIGVAGSGSLSVHTSSRVAIRSSALSLLPVLKPAIAVAFKDRYQLITRCRQMPSYSYAPLRLVSAFMRTLLTDVSYTASILTVLDSGEADSGAGNVFGSGGSADFLEGSRLSGTCTPVQQYVSEWVESVLVKLLVGHVVSGEEGVAVELCAIIKDIILLTQHRIMATTRQEVASSVLQKLFYLLENYGSLATHHASVPSYEELSSWALLLMRYTAHMDTPLPNSSSNTSGGDGGDRSDSAGFGGSANSTQNAFGSPARGSDKNAHHGGISPAPRQAVEFITYHYHVRLFKILCEVTDVVAQTRFFAEFAMLLLHRTVHEDEAVELTMNASEEWDRFSASRSGYKFAVTLPSAVLRSHPVRLLLECGTRTAANAVLGRFVTALCDSYHALLQYTLTPLLVLWPAVHQRAQVGMGAGSTSSRGGGSKGSAAQADFMDFAPTVAATSTGGGGGEGGGYEKKITCDPLLLPVLQAHLDGTQELLHPWSLVHDPLCTGRIKQACSAIHTLLMLHPVSAAAATAGGEKNENNATGVAEGEVVAKLLDPKELAVRVRAEFDKLVAILVRLLEGSVFAIKTFEHCFKWPLGEGSDQNAHAYFKSDSSQQSLITLVHLVTKLLNTSTTTGLFNFSSTGVSAFATTNAAVFTPTGQVGAAMISTTELLKQLAPVTAKYNETVVKLRTELTYVLHLALEWLTQDYSKVQNGPYIQQFLVTMIKHRLTLPMSGNDAVFGGTAEADALGTADLILKHIKCMIYNTAAHQEYLLTLQAKSMQGMLGAGQHARYDGLSSGLSCQLQALELLHLLAMQHSSPSSPSHASSSSFGNTAAATAGRGGSSGGASVLQLCVQLLREIERDYLWSETLETKSAFSCTPTDSSSLHATWRTPTGTEITKLSVSPVLKEKIALTLAAVLALVVPVTATASSKVWAEKLYTVQEIRDFLRQGADMGNVLARNDLDFGTVSALPSAPVSNDGFAPTVSSFAATAQNKADTKLEMPGVASKDKESAKISVTESALALLEFYRTDTSAHTFDTSDHTQVRGLFSPLNTAYASAAISPGAYVCHADLLAQIADVQQSHLRSLDSVSSSAAGSSFGPDNRMDANLSLLSPGNHGQSQSKSHNLHQTQSNGSSLDQDRDNGHNYEAHQQAVLSTAMLPPREKFWTQLSGSADLLTVLAYSEIDLLTMTAAVHVRVFNSSGFKIPTFALHLVASADLLSVDHTQGLCAHTAPLGATMAGSAASVVTQTQQHLLLSAGQGFSLPPQAVYFDESCVISAPGVDFFLPEAYVERTLTCKVRQFAPFEAVVRIVYADLVYDEDNIYEIPQDGNLGTSRAGGHHKSAAAKKSKSANANASSRGARYMEEYKDNQSNKWSAVLDCAPLRVPISAQLLPYGFGTCSAMSYWYQHHQSNHGRTVISELHSPGIPESVFQNQWRRLGGRFECSAPVVGDIHFPHPSVVAVAGFPYLAAQVNVHLDASIRSAISAYGGTGMHLLGLDGKVRFDGLTSHRYTLHSYCDPALTSATAGRHPASQEAVGFSAVSAWSLLTAQGAEVSVKLIIDTPPASSTIVAGANAVSASTSGTASLFEAMSLDALETSYRKHHSSADALEWTGRVVVRCSDHPTQQAVVCDMELFLYALSGGFISLSEPL